MTNPVTIQSHDGIAVLLASVVGHFSHEVQELRVRLDRIDSTPC